jgi:ABC-type transport system substrate-binding protein
MFKERRKIMWTTLKRCQAIGVFKTLGLLVVAFLILQLPGGVMNAAPASKVLTVLVPAEFPHLDPGETVSGDQYMLKYHIFNRLFTFNEKMEPFPDLVTKESLSKDGTTWTFDLRPGVKFHDGTVLNAEAVKYTIERLQKGTGNQKALYTMIKEVQAVSETRVLITTNGLFPALRNNLAHPDAGIVPPLADQKLGKLFGKQPVGAGPYKFSEWLTGDHITVVRNDQYYGPKPYFEKIDFKFVSDATTRTLMLDTGQTDVALRVPPNDVARLKANPSIKIDQVLGRNIYFALNQTKPPFNDIRVRKAVNYAVDKQAICDRVLFGAAKPSHSFVEAVQGTIDAGFYAYDPEKAKSLIKEAGATGAKVVLVTPTTRYMLDSEVSQAVAGYLRQAGLDVEVRAFGDWPSCIDTVRRGEFHMHMLGWGGSTGDPDNAFRIQLHSNNAGKLWNAGSYRNPKVDSLIEEGSKEFDLSKRAKIYAEIQKIAWDDAPWLFLHRLSIYIAYKSDIQGTKILPGTEMPYFWLAQR